MMNIFPIDTLAPLFISSTVKESLTISSAPGYFAGPECPAYNSSWVAAPDTLELLQGDGPPMRAHLIQEDVLFHLRRGYPLK